MDLTVLLLTLNEERNAGLIISQVQQQLDPLSISYEILVVDGGSADRTVACAKDAGAVVKVQEAEGYAAALREGIVAAKGYWVITLDVDGSHPPQVVRELWNKRHEADCVIASRFISGGSSQAPFIRKALSRVLSIIYPRLLALPVRDVSSGYRLFRREVVANLALQSRDFSVLLEILIHLVVEGRQICEIPLVYSARLSGSSKARIIQFGISYLNVIKQMWGLRNSAAAADYDSRAFDSIIPIQRYWQRKRHKIVQAFLGDKGCGSSRIIQGLPQAVAADYSLPKLRFLAGSNPLRCQMTIFVLPFKTDAFESIICSQVIEHVKYSETIISELARILKPGGRLVIGTPDYGRIWWPIIEFFYHLLLPNAYADEHITHYSKAQLVQLLEQNDFSIQSEEYICGGELILLAIKNHSPNLA